MTSTIVNNTLYLAYLLFIYFIIKEETKNAKSILNKNTNKKDYTWIGVFALTLFVRFIFLFSLNFRGDAISQNIQLLTNINNQGLIHIYDSNSNAFTSIIPPLLGIVFSVFNNIGHLFHLSANNIAFSLRAFIALADVFTVLIVYFILRGKLNGKVSGILISLLIFSPYLISGSAISSYEIVLCVPFVLLAIKNIVEKKYLSSLIYFTIAVLLEQYIFIFLPLILFLILKNKPILCERLFYRINLTEKFITLYNSIFLVVYTLLVSFAMSFVIGGYGNPFYFIASYFTDYYNVASATFNAFNFYMFTGSNFLDINYIFMFTNFTIFSAIIYVLFAGFAIYFLNKNPNEDKIYLIFSTFAFCVFIFSTRISEMQFYLIPILLIISLSRFIDSFSFFAYGFTTVMGYLNLWYVLDISKDQQTKMIIKNTDIFSRVCSELLIVASFLVLFYCIQKMLNIHKFEALESTKTNDKNKELVISKSYKMVKKDIIFMLTITLVYAATALYGIGDMKAPQTYEIINKGESIIVDLGEEKSIESLKINQGLWLGSYTLDGSLDKVDFQNLTSIEQKRDFSWSKTDLTGLSVRYLKLTYVPQIIEKDPTNTDNDRMMTNELAVVGPNEVILPPKSVEIVRLSGTVEQVTKLTDESSLVPKIPTSRNGTIFDEIYHPRTAFEFLHGFKAYETTHPNLGKSIIALGIKMFGMTPFGWRIMGILFGILMVPMLYMFIKRIFKNTFVAVAGTILFAFDFMHLVQTRLATIDTYIVFFMIVMYYFMYIFYEKSTLDDKITWRSLGALSLSGIFFGLAIASKWTGIYAGIGLAAIYIIAVVNYFKMYDKNKLRIKFDLLKLLLVSFIFYLIVPLFIYAESFIPFLRTLGYPLNFNTFVEMQKFMYNYHATLKDAHPFSSFWFEWLLDRRPMAYYDVKNIGDGLYTTGVVALGNPLTWIVGFAAMFKITFNFLKKNTDMIALFILLGFFSQLIPWIPITRVVFIYHYFPATVFFVLGICYFIDKMIKKNEASKKYIIGFIAICVLFYALYYPYLIGDIVAPGWYLEMLQLIPAWPFGTGGI